MFKALALLIEELKKNTLATICGLLIAAVVYLCLYVLSLQKDHAKKEDALNAKIQELNSRLVEQERESSAKLAAIWQAQINELKEALNRQAKIEAEQKRLLKQPLK